MKVVVIAASFFLTLKAYEVTHTNATAGLPLLTAGDYVEAWTLRDSLENGNLLHIEYKCSNSSFVFVRVQVLTESQQDFTIFRKKYECKVSEDKQEKVIKLQFPRYISFKPDIHNKYSVYIDEAVVKCWMVNSSQKWQGFSSSTVKKQFQLKIVQPFDRPAMVLDKCFAWWYEIRILIPYSPTCSLEEEVVKVLSFPMALDGSGAGLVKAFDPYKSKVLEKTRTWKTANSGFSAIFWIYVVDYCPGSTHCSLMHHATWDDSYLTPLFLINKKGQIHVEIILKNKETAAYLTFDNFIIPKEEWVQLVFSFNITGMYCNIYMRDRSDMSRWRSAVVEITTSGYIEYNDVRGIFYFGGSELHPSFRGYLGEIYFYRRRVIDPQQREFAPRDEQMFKLDLKERADKCRKYRNKVRLMQLKAESMYQGVITKSSCPTFQNWVFNLIERKKYPECKMEHFPNVNKHFRYVNQLVKRWVFSKKADNFPDFAALLLSRAYQILDVKGLDGVPDAIPLLKQSSCFGNHDASFMLSTIINYGLYVDIDMAQSYAYLLAGSTRSNRLCLLSLANKHAFGIDGIPKDDDQAYVYFMNVARLTKNDLLKHDDRDIATESVRLTDEVTLRQQTGEDEDLFLWLKHQASKGITDAQKKLAGMLYWGTQGVSRNTSKASAYFEAAASSGDATAIYDYGILLLKGHGVQQNITKAVEHFKMAADKKHAQSINTLGWYALVYKSNYTEAANYFEEAFRLGNPDAGHNLAHMLLSGTFPDLNRVERVLAWDFFSKAALGGNYDSGLLVARYNMIGHPRTTRSPSLSVDWGRYLAEQNPAIGKLLRNGLSSFKKQNWPVALVYYLMAASTGVEVANFNLAFLCEENYEYLTSSMLKECTWRHYNLSTLRSSKSENPYAWLKMADYHYMHHNLTMAALTYAEAASKGDPQGYYSLATMIENNDKVPDVALKLLGVSFSITRNKELLLYHLYTKCRDSRKSDAFIPCSLALWNVKIQHFWIRHGHKITGIAIAISTLFLISLISWTLRCIHSSRLLLHEINYPLN